MTASRLFRASAAEKLRQHLQRTLVFSDRFLLRAMGFV
jgi:hypothetical protein